MTQYADVLAYLRALGFETDMDSFVGRKRVQKTVYLLRQFGADLRFGYTWYLHGPYSPQLTKTLFNPTEEDLATEKDLGKPELSVVNSMRNFLGEDLYSVDSLELVGSLVYLIKHAPSEGFDSKNKIIDYLLERKPQFSKEKVKSAWKKIEKWGIWNEYLDKLA